MQLLLRSLALLVAMGALPAPGQDERKTVTPEGPSRVALTYLGGAGWIISDGRVTIVIDPFVSRPRFSEAPGKTLEQVPGEQRPIHSATDPLVPDEAAIDKRIPKADYVLIHHSHVDHMLDAPYLARSRGAQLIGHESATNIARAGGVPDSQLITVRGGEDYEFGSFSLRVIPSLHSTLDRKHYYDSRTAPRDIKLPQSSRGYPEGGSLAYLIRIGGRKILTFGSMNYIERELEGLRPDVVLVGWNRSQVENYDYLGRLMRVLDRPPIVLPTHWDDGSLPFESPQTEAWKRLEAFRKEVRALSPATRVIIPRYFEPVELPPVRPHSAR